MEPKPQRRRLRKVNPQLAALMKAGMGEDISIEDLGRTTGLGRQAIGRIVRGEVHRIAPEQANVLVQHVPITMTQLLEACGYAVGKDGDVPEQVKQAWPSLTDEIRRAIVHLATVGARLSNASRESAP